MNWFWLRQLVSIINIVAEGIYRAAAKSQLIDRKDFSLFSSKIPQMFLFLFLMQDRSLAFWLMLQLNKLSEEVTLGSWWAFFIVFWHSLTK